MDRELYTTLGKIDERTVTIQAAISDIKTQLEDVKKICNTQTLKQVKDDIVRKKLEVCCPILNPKIKYTQDGKRKGKFWYHGSLFKKGVIGSAFTLGAYIALVLFVEYPEEVILLLKLLGVV